MYIAHVASSCVFGVYGSAVHGSCCFESLGVYGSTVEVDGRVNTRGFTVRQCCVNIGFSAVCW